MTTTPPGPGATGQPSDSPVLPELVLVQCYWLDLEGETCRYDYYARAVPGVTDTVTVYPDAPSRSSAPVGANLAAGFIPDPHKQCLHVYKRVWLDAARVELHCDRVD